MKNEIGANKQLLERIKEEKPFSYIVQNLENTFGEPKLTKKAVRWRC